jgi:hypothetical protein
MLQEFGWEVSEHPACSAVEGMLGGRRFRSDEEVKDDAKAWLNGLAAEGYTKTSRSL